MATVTGLTAERMLEIEAACIVDGAVILDDLHLTRHDGTSFNAGNVRGSQGIQGPTGRGFNPRGAWASGAVYAVDDLVRYTDGSTYRVAVAHTASGTTLPPSHANYSLFAQVGQQGIQGIPGPSGTITSATATAQAAGTTPSVTLGGTESARTMDFGIPSGAQGIQGPSGTITSATATAKAAGTAPSVTLGGTASARTIDFGIPTGATGATGRGFNPRGAWASGTVYAVDDLVRYTDGSTYRVVTAHTSSGTTLPPSHANYSLFAQAGAPGEATNATVNAGDYLNRQMALMQRLFFGGGVRKTTAVGVAWSQTFIVIGQGMDTNSPAGYHNVTMPANNTVIPVYGEAGRTSVTVANGVIPMGTWDALYYDMPLGGNGGSVDGRYKIVAQLASRGFEIPASWILVCVSNGYQMSPRYMWGDGRAQDPWRTMTLTGAWTAFDPGYGTPSYRLGDDGQVHTKGLMKGGNLNVAFFTLPIELGADVSTGGELFTQFAGSGSARIDVNMNGTMMVVLYATGGNNAAVSLANMAWYPKGS